MILSLYHLCPCPVLKQAIPALHRVFFLLVLHFYLVLLSCLCVHDLSVLVRGQLYTVSSGPLHLSGFRWLNPGRFVCIADTFTCAAISVGHPKQHFLREGSEEPRRLSKRTSFVFPSERWCANALSYFYSFHWKQRKASLYKIEDSHWRQRKISLKVFKINPPRPQPSVVVHTFNPGTFEVEAGRSLDSRPLWSTE